MNIIVPEKCFSLNNMTINSKTKLGQVIEIRAFETGYYRTEFLMTQEGVDCKNAEMGVNKAQAQAMESASMFGWACYKNCLEAFEKSKEKI